METWLGQILSAFSKPFKWWVVIAPWEQGILVRLGKVAYGLQPGFHFRFPFLDRVYVQSIRLRAIHDSNQTVMTTDGKAITISSSLEFSVSDVRKLYETIANPEQTLLLRNQSLITEWVSSHALKEVTARSLQDHVTGKLDGVQWGLSGLRMRVVSFVSVRTYRLLMNDYRGGAGLEDLEGDKGQ